MVRVKQILLGYAYTILVGKPEGKRPLRKPRHRWKIILQSIFGEIGW
jgi:hypothetical protein